MSAAAGDPCCFCGDRLVSDGERVFCASRDASGAVCVGRLRPQEDPPADIERLRAVGRAILANLEDRRDIKRLFGALKNGDRFEQFVYQRMEWELGQVAIKAVEASR